MTPERFLAAIGGEGRLSVSHCIASSLNTGHFGPRVLDTNVLWCMLQGRIVGHVEGKPIAIEPGMIHWLSPGQHDDFHVDESCLPMRVYSMRFAVHADGPIEGGDSTADAAAASPSLRTPHDHLLLQAGPQVRDWYQRLVECHRGSGPLRDRRFRALLVLLLAEVLRLAEADDATRTQASLTTDQVSRLHQLFEERAHHAIGPADMAETLRLSHDYFTRKFRAHFGQPPRQWLREQRLRKAANLLLETQLSVKEVAARCGYSDQRFFARDFGKFHHLSPTAYRHERGL